SKAWDGVSGTLWCCEEGEDVNSWWMVDLGRKKALDKIKVQYRNISGKFQFLPISVTVQVSDDDANWTTVTSKSSNVPKAGSDYDSKPYEYAVGADARYLRLLFEDGGSVYSDIKCVQLNEVDMILKN
ncbi:MAG: discoidin domain-containing protein, partial [Lentisphaerota bacterium]